MVTAFGVCCHMAESILDVLETPEFSLGMTETK